MVLEGGQPNVYVRLQGGEGGQNALNSVYVVCTQSLMIIGQPAVTDIFRWRARLAWESTFTAMIYYNGSGVLELYFDILSLRWFCRLLLFTISLHVC